MNIIRPCKICGRLGYHKYIDCDNRDEHESETALDGCDSDYIIRNDGDLDYLIGSVRAILEREKIL